MTQSRMFQPEAETDDELGFMVMLLDLQDAAPPIRRLRDWAVDLAQPQPGEVALDVGSGTGTMVRTLAALVAPSGRATGVEPNPKLRDIAASRAAALPGAEFVDGVAGALDERPRQLLVEEGDAEMLGVDLGIAATTGELHRRGDRFLRLQRQLLEVHALLRSGSAPLGSR